MLGDFTGQVMDVTWTLSCMAVAVPTFPISGGEQAGCHSWLGCSLVLVPKSETNSLSESWLDGSLNPMAFCDPGLKTLSQVVSLSSCKPGKECAWV